MSAAYRPVYTKSRHSCGRYKDKRVKCDQRRPGCKRCEDAGSQCPGYVFNLRWSAKNQLLQKSINPSSKLKPQTRREDQTPPSSTSHLNEQETMDITTSNLDPLLLFPHFADPSPNPFPVPFDTHFLGLGDDVSLSQWPFPGLYNSGAMTIPGGSALADDSPELDRTIEWTGSNADMSANPQTAGHPLDVDWLAIQSQPNPGESSGTSRPTNVHNNGQSNDLAAGSDRPPLVRLRQLSNLPTALSDFFFREVIPLYCAWDSESNLMRVVAENAWQSSKVLYHTMQSMAAACLTSVFLELSATAIQERFVALRCLDESQPGATDNPEARLSATVLLCHTASWHDPGNLAKERYHMTQKLVLEWGSNTTGTDSKPMAKFSQTAVDYWGMLLSFFTDISDVPCGVEFTITHGPTKFYTTSRFPYSTVVHRPKSQKVYGK
ncbi:uncharacterized protein FTOL_07878 [Fusarium torulosum]|uniref:Zn(2)-C6 fungal-type domain-containing protein n=1 Tax=Fusarium torulosum TaxID=33205 RepID=A0AAE8MC92_9HYPO|nr:uncharacterized protein FTOL_07878 [Fusarium torulosum]